MQDTNIEPVLEAILVNQNEGMDEMNKNLEAIIVQNEENKLEPILENMIIQNDENTQKIVDAIAPPKIEIEVDGATIEVIEGPKGDTGPEPTDQRLISLIEPLIPEGKDGIDGKDGISVDKNEVVNSVLDIVLPEIPTAEEIVALISIPKNGVDGKDANENEIIKTVLEIIPKPKNGINGKDGSPDNGVQIVSKLRKLKKGERLSYEDLDDTPTYFQGSSKTVSLVELDDVNLTGVTKTNGKYDLGSGGSGAVSSVNTLTGAVVLTKSNIGLANVDNTSDATKNSAVSTLTNKTLTAPKFSAYDSLKTSAGATILELGYYGTPANYIVVETAEAGGNPVIQTAGTDTNIGLQFVTKGTGRLKVGAGNILTDISTDTVTNKTIVSPVFTGVTRAATGGTKNTTVGGKIKEYYTNAGNITTGETDLYSYTTEASLLGANGDVIKGEYTGTFAIHASNTRQVKLYFGGSVIFDSGALGATVAYDWNLDFTIIRVSSTVVRYKVVFIAGNYFIYPKVLIGELTGLTLSNTNILKITGTATITDDIIAKMGCIEYLPVSV